MRDKLERRVNEAIATRVFPGCVIGVVRSGSREIFPFGRFTYEAHSPQVEENSLYDVASITKSIPTASLAIALIEEGKLQLPCAVREYLPELKNDFGATIEDLLRYRVFGVQLSTLKDKTADEMIAAVFESGFNGKPGEGAYTNLPAFLIGLIIERISGRKLDELARECFFAPLAMTRTFFASAFPSEKNMAIYRQIVPTEIDEVEGIVRGVPHDESARALARPGRACPARATGHAGLFSAAPDLLLFLGALLRGELGAVAAGAQQGLGWQVSDSRFIGRYAGERAFGKTGFTGTSVVCDIERGIALVILSNRTYPKRPSTDDAIYEFRRDIADIVFTHARA